MNTDAVASVSKGLDCAVSIGLVCLDRFTTLLGARPFRNCHRDRPAPMEIAMSDRIIRDELLTSERYWSVSNEAKLLYLHLILNVDDTARFSGKNFTLRTSCFPSQGMEPAHMERLLDELQTQDLIRLYMIDNERFVFIPRFKQRLRFINSKFPEPPKEINDLKIKKSDSSQTQDSLKSDSSQQKLREVKRSEEKLREVKRKDIAQPDGVLATPKGSRLPDDWEPTDEMIAYCKTKRPDLDYKEVAENFRDWWIAQPGQKGVKRDWAATWRTWVRGERRTGKAKQTAEPWTQPGYHSGRNTVEDL